jgi:hypothetical protein
LEDTSANSAIAVWGFGGAGKTALTYESVQRVASGNSYTHIAWASARNTRFSTEYTTSAAINSIYWHDLVAMIARQLDCALSPSQALWEHDLQSHLEHNLGDCRVLIVVDNLEFVEAADDLIGRLRDIGFCRPHRIVATTR